MSSSRLIQRHPFHLVDASPWPFFAGVSALALTTGFVMYMHCLKMVFILFRLVLFLCFLHFLFGGVMS